MYVYKERGNENGERRRGEKRAGRGNEKRNREVEGAEEEKKWLTKMERLGSRGEKKGRKEYFSIM